MTNETKKNALQKGKPAVQKDCQQNSQAQSTQDSTPRRIPTLIWLSDAGKVLQVFHQGDTHLNSTPRGDGTTAKSAKSAICPDCPYLDEIPPAPAKIIQELQQRIEQLLK